MLPKKYRLNKKETENIFRRGKVFRGNFLLLKTRKNNLPLSRWSFIVPVSLSKKTIIRNRIKRRLSENLQKKIKNIKPGIDCIVLALDGALGKTYLNIEQELDKLLHRSKLI